jgi:hypothetical protein
MLVFEGENRGSVGAVEECALGWSSREVPIRQAVRNPLRPKIQSARRRPPSRGSCVRPACLSAALQLRPGRGDRGRIDSLSPGRRCCSRPRSSVLALPLLVLVNGRRVSAGRRDVLASSPDALNWTMDVLRSPTLGVAVTRPAGSVGRPSPCSRVPWASFRYSRGGAVEALRLTSSRASRRPIPCRYRSGRPRSAMKRL